MNLDDYINLQEVNLEDYEIIRKNEFECMLVSKRWTMYEWFLLSESDWWNAYTICDVTFNKTSNNTFIPKLIFRRTNKELQDKPLMRSSYHQRISFKRSADWYNEFWQMIHFLNSFKELVDLWEFTNQYSIVSTDDFIVWFKDKESADKISDISKIIDSSDLSSLEIETLSTNIIYKEREKSLQVFKLLLDNEEISGEKYIDKYKKHYSLWQRWEEIAWHHFLKNNSWIIWINLDLKFISDFESEWNVWVTNTLWTWSPNVDLIGLSDYTILVELKTANKQIFKTVRSTTSRANTWSFSSDFIDWISQCLWQKTEWDKSHSGKDLITTDDESWKQEIVNQNLVRTLDSDCIFIIWNKESEIPSDSLDPEIINKRDTFQRYRMNSKNVKIITFDELYERASNILKLDV